MTIISRDQAKKQNLTYFFTGKPCIKGHISPRLVSNRGCIDCRLVHSKSYKRRNKKQAQLTNNLYRKTHPIIGMIEGARYRAKKQNVPFNITVKDVVIPEMCPILKIPLFFGQGKPSANSPSIDRIIPDLGYVVGNICVISHRANTIKNDANIEELQSIISYIQSFKG